MKRYIPYIYTGLFIAIAGNASASTNMEMNSMSTAMLTFIAAALIALTVTYSMWKINDLKRRKVIQKLIQRGPVKRTPVPAIHKKRAATVEQVK